MHFMNSGWSQNRDVYWQIISCILEARGAGCRVCSKHTMQSCSHPSHSMCNTDREALVKTKWWISEIKSSFLRVAWRLCTQAKNEHLRVTQWIFKRILLKCTFCSVVVWLPQSACVWVGLTPSKRTPGSFNKTKNGEQRRWYRYNLS